MATFANVVVNDRETSPVAHTFVATSRPSGDSILLKESGIVPAGDSIMLARVQRMPDGSYRCRLNTKIPVLGTRVADGITSYEVLDEANLETIIRFSARSTLQFRKNAIGIHANALAASVATVNDAFTKVEGW